MTSDERRGKTIAGMVLTEALRKIAEQEKIIKELKEDLRLHREVAAQINSVLKAKTEN